MKRKANPASETPISGLRTGALSPWETLAQSVSTIAPSTMPTVTMPLIVALSGPASWLAYAIALVAMTLIAWCVAEFARDSSSPGSIYSYVRTTLPPAFAVTTAWALLFAYALTGSSVLGGFLSYSSVLLGPYATHISPALLAAVATSVAVAIAAFDVKLSSRMMLSIEAVSIASIVVVLAAVLWRRGFHLDSSQFVGHGEQFRSVRLGVMLALFSFVGFESATAMGGEARQPLTTIPRAVVWSAVLTGVFFVVSAYTEVLGFAGASQGLATSAAPMRDLSARYGLRLLGPVIDAGVLVSMFACVLACVTAGSRVLLMMAHEGLVHRCLARVHARSASPLGALFLVGLVVAAPTTMLAWQGSSPADIYGWLGTLSVFGFLTAYGIAAVALPVHLNRHRRLTVTALMLAGAASLVTVLLLLGSIYPLPTGPARFFPAVYVVYLCCGLGWCSVTAKWGAMATRSAD